MSKKIKISDWVTEEEFNYSPTGELSAVLYLAEQRSEWFAKGEKAAEVRILDMLRRWDSFTNDVNQFQDEMRRACDIGYEYGEEAREERLIWLLKDLEKTTFPGDVWHINPFTYAIEMIERLRNDNNSK